jgi:hypothetical protein
VQWALGYLVAHAPNKSIRRLAEDLFRLSLGNFESMGSPRAWALAIAGLYYYLREFPDDQAARTVLMTLARRLENAFEEYEGDGWAWCEDVVTWLPMRTPACPKPSYWQDWRSTMRA